MKNGAIKAILKMGFWRLHVRPCRRWNESHCGSLSIQLMLLILLGWWLWLWLLSDWVWLNGCWMVWWAWCAYMGITPVMWWSSFGLSAGCVNYAVSALVVPTADNTVAGYLQRCDSKYNSKTGRRIVQFITMLFDEAPVSIWMVKWAIMKWSRAFMMRLVRWYSRGIFLFCSVFVESFSNELEFLLLTILLSASWVVFRIYS